MNTWLSFILSLGAIILAMSKTSKLVSLYFRAQLIATLALFAGVRMLGDNSALYRLIYVAVTLLILETCVFLIWDSGERWQNLTAAMSFGLFCGLLALPGIPHFNLDVWIVYVEGILLSIIGMGMLLVAPRLIDRSAVTAIGMLSLALSCFDFGFVQHANWEQANNFVPSLLCIAAWGWIGLQKKRVPA